MKKIILLVALFAISAPIFAQQTQKGSAVSNSVLIKKIERALSRIAASKEKAPWVVAVKKEEKLAYSSGTLGFSAYGLPARHFPQDPLVGSKEIYAPRLAMLRDLIDNNHTLKGYMLRVPRPDDLVSLTPSEMRFLENFLEQSVLKKSFDTRYAPAITHPKSAETQLTFTQKGKKMILLINSRPEEKNIYFFLNNVPTNK